jgi:hypothetical protein
MIEPTQKDVGRKVIYKPGLNDEVGIINSFNDHVVFVRYNGSIHSQGTRREDLQWVTA